MSFDPTVLYSPSWRLLSLPPDPKKWDARYIDLARLVSSWSKDPSTKCGAAVVRPDRTLAGVGFNGFPKGVLDDSKFYDDRELKYSRVVHAELNALLLAREPLDGYTLYTWPPGWGPTCDRCAAHVIQAGITRVVHIRNDSDFASRWKEPAERGLDMYREAKIEVVSYNAEMLGYTLPDEGQG